jgi:hypothetical protein
MGNLRSTAFVLLLWYVNWKASALNCVCSVQILLSYYGNNTMNSYLFWGGLFTLAVHIVCSLGLPFIAYIKPHLVAEKQWERYLNVFITVWIEGLLRALVPRPFLYLLFAGWILVIAQESTIVTIIIEEKKEKRVHEGGGRKFLFFRRLGAWALCEYTGRHIGCARTPPYPFMFNI